MRKTKTIKIEIYEDTEEEFYALLYFLIAGIRSMKSMNETLEDNQWIRFIEKLVNYIHLPILGHEREEIDINYSKYENQYTIISKEEHEKKKQEYEVRRLEIREFVSKPKPIRDNFKEYEINELVHFIQNSVVLKELPDDRYLRASFAYDFREYNFPFEVRQLINNQISSDRLNWKGYLTIVRKKLISNYAEIY